MELRHLRYFVAVAEELHFRRAAERLHVAQPAVSEQIRKLEAEVGVQLLERTQRSVALTPAGLAMLEEARRVLRQAAIAVQAAQSAGDAAAQTLRVGYLPDCVPATVPKALQRVTAGHPGLNGRLEAGPAASLVERVRDGGLDAAVVPLPASTNGLQVSALGAQGAVAAFPLSHSQAVESRVDLSRLDPDRIVVMPPEGNQAFHNAVVSACHQAGISPSMVEVEEPHVEHVLLAVAAGAGMALLPDSVPERFITPGVRFVALEGVEPSYKVGAVTRLHDDSLVVHSFVRTLTSMGVSTSAVDTAPALTLAA
jgi:DNA-binding transcriptional LysR family regulator